MADKQGRKTGGRKAGVKNLKTQAKEAVRADARIAATAAVVSAGSRPERKVKPSLAPRPGMSAKDIMVDAMREAHDAYRAQCLKASEVMDDANARTSAALDLTIGPDEKPEAFKLAVDALLALASTVREQAIAIRHEAQASLSLALDTAHKVAPYDHAKLQTSNVQGDLNLNVTIAKF